MDAERFVRMANQIADFFDAYPEAEAIAETENHIRLFWDPRMRTALAAHVMAGGAGLSPVALAAARRLQGPAGQAATG